MDNLLLELSVSSSLRDKRIFDLMTEMLNALKMAELVCAKQTGMSYADRREAHEMVLAAIAKAK